ncbi:hypothetical protein PG999_003850 [Apiospora kogelbergensis]|uniref:Uncharacterized protein n=1 Tax=Apiospora kogelbergensis TaxID=1337665 RepID=A0AAW0R4X2_9PEZI
MCEKHYYYYQRGDKIEKETDTQLCSNSSNDRPCQQAAEFHHSRDERNGSKTVSPAYSSSSSSRGNSVFSRRSVGSSKSSWDGVSIESEDDRLLKLEREVANTKEVLHRQQLQSRIERQNEAIKSRPPIPLVPAARAHRSLSVVADAMRNVRIGSQSSLQMERERRRRERRTQEELKEREEAALKERLRARMARHRASITLSNVEEEGYAQDLEQDLANTDEPLDRWTLPQEEEPQEQQKSDQTGDSPSRSSVHVEQLICKCEVLQTIEEMRKIPGEGDSSAFDLLKNFVVINGSPRGLECTTCSSYLTRRWGKVGLTLLQQLSDCIDDFQRPLDAKREPSSSSLSIRIFVRSNFVCLVPWDDETIVDTEVVAAFTWLCTAIRNSPKVDSNNSSTKSIHLSKAEIRTNSNNVMDLRITQEAVSPEQLRDLLHPDSTCWLPMFKSVVVAWQSDEDAFLEGGLPGLEIPFDMMVHLASAENYHQVDGGIVLLGFFTALVPIRRHPDSNTIQWHLESIGNDDLMQPCNLESIKGDWYKTTDISELANSRCVVGWFEQANIMLGTSSLVESNKLTWSSGIPSRHRTAHREGFEGGGQISFSLGPINIAPQGMSTWRFHSNVQAYKAPNEYRQAIRLSARKVATLIDTNSKQAWLVPMLSLVLHLCHRYYQEVKLDDEMNDPIPFAEPSPNGASAAIRAIENKGDLIVVGKSGEPDCETLRQLVLRINCNLLDSSATREPPRGDLIFASELMDAVVEPGSGSALKEIGTSEDASSWKDLASKADVIGVCADIGEVIQPIPEPGTLVRPNCECMHLPQSLYLLAAHSTYINISPLSIGQVS